MFEEGDRMNRMYAVPLVYETVQILQVLAQNAPQSGTAHELSQITGIGPRVCQQILISLAFDGWIRETAEGFQTIGQRLERIDAHGHRILDQSFADMGQALPRRRPPLGDWEREAALNSCA